MPFLPLPELPEAVESGQRFDCQASAAADFTRWVLPSHPFSPSFLDAVVTLVDKQRGPLPAALRAFRLPSPLQKRLGELVGLGECDTRGPVPDGRDGAL